MSLKHLTKLNIRRNTDGKMHCPMTYKILNDNMKIVAIKSTGNVFSGSVVDELNKKQAYWFDLLTDTPFKPEEIIVLQDPMNLKNRLINNFSYKKRGLSAAPKEFEEENEQKMIEQSSLGKRILQEASEKHAKDDIKDQVVKKVKTRKVIYHDEMLSVDDFLAERMDLKDWKHSKVRTGLMATSVTSTAMDLQTKDDFRDLTKTEMLFEIWNEVKKYHLKTYLQIMTNLGSLNIVLHSDQAARTCFSFLECVKGGALDGIRFCTLVEGVFVQLNNPKIDKLELASLDRSEKLVHDKGGFLTLNTSGKLNSMAITLAASEQLNMDHVIFGEVVGNFDIIKKVSDMGADEVNGLKAYFKIEKVEVINNGFEESCQRIRKRLLGIDKLMEKKMKEEEKKRQKNEFLSKILI